MRHNIDMLQQLSKGLNSLNFRPVSVYMIL